MVIAVGALWQAPAQAASTKCANVRVERKQGTLTESVAAHRVRASGTTCKRARHIAKVAAREALDRGAEHVRSTIDGFRVVVKNTGCTGCAPEWPTTATKPGSRVTFLLLGGA
jgi:hypothetical protein